MPYLDYCDIEWFALETNRNHSVIFEIVSKYCILDSFVDHDGYSICSEGFLPTVVDVMVRGGSWEEPPMPEARAGGREEQSEEWWLHSTGGPRGAIPC